MIKYINGFPSSYVLENVLAMSEEEVLYWLKEYHHFNKGKDMKKVTRTEETAKDQDRNLIGDTENSYQCYEDSQEDEEFEANQFTEDEPQEITAYFTGA